MRGMLCSMVSVSAVLVGCSAPQAPVPAEIKPAAVACSRSAEDHRLAGRLRSEFYLALNRGDVDAAMAQFSTRAIVNGPDVKSPMIDSMAVGKPELIREFLANDVVLAGRHFSRVGVVGAAVVDCDVFVSADATSVQHNGEEARVPMSFTLKREDGQWRILMLTIGKMP